MKKEYKEALSEVNIVLENTEDEIVKKIPNNFIKFIKENQDKNYKIELEYGKSLIEQNLKKETREILALIYRDYICTPEERKELIKQEQEEKIRIEKEKEEKYNIDFNAIAENRRKNNIIEKLENTNNSMSLIEKEEEKWYKKIIYKILKFFKLK